MTLSTETTPLPVLAGLPLFGNLFDFRHGFLELIQRVAALSPAAQLRAGTRTITLLNAAEFAQLVLVEQAEAFEKSPCMLAALRPVLGNGLLTSLNVPHKPSESSSPSDFNTTASQRMPRFGACAAHGDRAGATDYATTEATAADASTTSKRLAQGAEHRRPNADKRGNAGAIHP